MPKDWAEFEQVGAKKEKLWVYKECGVKDSESWQRFDIFIKVSQPSLDFENSEKNLGQVEIQASEHRTAKRKGSSKIQ